MYSTIPGVNSYINTHISSSSFELLSHDNVSVSPHSTRKIWS